MTIIYKVMERITKGALVMGRRKVKEAYPSTYRDYEGPDAPTKHDRELNEYGFAEKEFNIGDQIVIAQKIAADIKSLSYTQMAQLGVMIPPLFDDEFSTILSRSMESAGIPSPKREECKCPIIRLGIVHNRACSFWRITEF